MSNKFQAKKLQSNLISLLAGPNSSSKKFNEKEKSLKQK